MAWWRKGPKETPEDRPPTDAETGHIMRSLADEFVQNARGADLIDYSVESVARLDHLIDGLLEDAPASDLDRESASAWAPVSKRFTIGPEHSLVQFVEAAVADEMPPEAWQLPRVLVGRRH